MAGADRLERFRNEFRWGGKIRIEPMGVELTTAQALQLWHDVSLDLVHDDHPDLTARQMTILLTVYLEAPPHTVRGLARKLGVSKPVITRALDSMGQQGLVNRRRDEKDKRNVLVQRTVEGSMYLDALAGLIRRRAAELHF